MTDFCQRSRKRTATASCRLTVERSHFRRKLDLCRGQVKLWMDSFFFCTYVKKVVNLSAPYQKGSVPRSCILICYAILSPLSLQRIVLFCFSPPYKLVDALEKYLFLCKYPRGYFLSRYTLIFTGNNSNVHFIINDFNSWWTDGKDEYLISLFSLQASVFPQAEPFRVCGRVSTCSSLSRRSDTLRTGRWDHTAPIVRPSAWKQQYRFILL